MLRRQLIDPLLAADRLQRHLRLDLTAMLPPLCHHCRCLRDGRRSYLIEGPDFGGTLYINMTPMMPPKKFISLAED